MPVSPTVLQKASQRHPASSEMCLDWRLRSANLLRVVPHSGHCTRFIVRACRPPLSDPRGRVTPCDRRTPVVSRCYCTVLLSVTSALPHRPSTSPGAFLAPLTRRLSCYASSSRILCVRSRPATSPVPPSKWSSRCLISRASLRVSVTAPPTPFPASPEWWS